MIPQHSVTRIILARHGEASYPGSNDSDADGGTLTELGRSQAHALGVRANAEKVAAIYCSALSRATQTAAVVAELLDLPVQVQPGLREYEPGDEPFDLGALTTVLVGWLNGVLDTTVLGGESGHQVAQRMFAALDDIVQRQAGTTVLVVSHGGAILATLGSIAPGRTGLPADSGGQLREQDMPGGASFSIEHRPDGWHLWSDDVRR